MNSSSYKHFTNLAGPFPNRNPVNPTHYSRWPSTLPTLLHDPSSRTATFTVLTPYSVAPQNRNQPHPTLPGMYTILIYIPNPYTNPPIYSNNPPRKHPLHLHNKTHQPDWYLHLGTSPNIPDLTKRTNWFTILWHTQLYMATHIHHKAPTYQAAH